MVEVELELEGRRHVPTYDTMAKKANEASTVTVQSQSQQKIPNTMLSVSMQRRCL